MLHFLIIGFILGLSAGFSPGPLLTLVLTETLRYDFRAGVKVAVAPIITDLPIIACSVFVLGKLSQSSAVLAGISFCGALFIGRMGVENIRTGACALNVNNQEVQSSMRKGILTNILSPHPYLFWLTIGVPVLAKAMRQEFILVLVFLLSFYVLLVGSKVLLAVLVGKSRHFLSGKMYVNVMRSLGLVLCVLAAGLLYDGIQLLSHRSALVF